MKMHTLIIHAPKSKCNPTLGNCFADYFRTGVGKDYVIGKGNKSKLTIPGSRLVLLDKESKLRAEGTLIKLVPTKKTPQQRYDVHFEDQKMVPYASVKLNYYGIAVLDC
jgi:hypothetical protein